MIMLAIIVANAYAFPVHIGSMALVEILQTVIGVTTNAKMYQSKNVIITNIQNINST